MKSIMQEASSVIKALEQAWLGADKPTEFSVKIFEEPKKNFFGMTTKSAKVGIFFQEETRKAPRPEHAKKARAERPQRQKFDQRADQKKVQPKKPLKKTVEKQQPVKSRDLEEPRQEKQEKREFWSDQMIKMAKEWLEGSLKSMNLSGVVYSADANNYYLRFTFEKPIAQTPEQEREIFRSFSFLMLQALKRRLKRPLRGYKIVLTSES